jgi:RHS repeat-associated protein
VEYDPYGKIVAETGNTETIFKFGGQLGVVTAPNGLCNMRFRWYDPDCKRFISEDSRLGTISDPLSLNRYLYAINDPLNFVDPQGEGPFLVLLGAIAIGAAAGAVAELVSAQLQDRAIDWEQLAANAIVGGIAGGAFAVLAGSGGVGFVAAGAISGALDGGGSYALGQVFKGNDIDAADLVLNTAIGAGLGGALGGFQSVGKGGAEAVQQFGTHGIRSLARRSVVEFAEGFIKGVALNYSVQGSKSAGSGAVGLLAGVIRGPVLQYYSPTDPGRRPPVPVAMGRVARIIPPAVGGKTRYIGAAGEHRHYRTYLDAVTQAGRPLPNVPSFELPAF